jgi:hypothetical protein
MSLRLLPHFHLASLPFDPANIKTHFPDAGILVLGGEVNRIDFNHQVSCSDSANAIFTMKLMHSAVPVIIAGENSPLIEATQNTKVACIAVSATDSLSDVARQLRAIEISRGCVQGAAAYAPA